MKKVLRFCFTFLFFILVSSINHVYASEIIPENVIAYMEENNILDDSEYFYMFGKMLNGNDEYDISSFKYTINMEEEGKVHINVILTDEEEGKIEKTTTLTLKDGLISYMNENEIDSLESRIDTIIFNQFIYSIGGARGYEEDVLIDWMNQINLDTVSENEGIDGDFEIVKYTVGQDGRKYEYEVSVPKSYTIDVNKVINTLPESNSVEIQNVEPGISSVYMTVYSEAHHNEMCDIYRRDGRSSQYELVGTVSCNNGEFTDIKLKDETVYYYQATVADTIACSKDVEVTTLKAPITGAFISFVGLIVFVGIGIVLYKINEKRKLFKRI